MTRILGFGALAWIALASPARADDWPRWRGPNGDSTSAAQGFIPDALKGAPAKLWTADVGRGYSAVTVAGRRAFTMGNSEDKDTVFCFDAVTGKELWRHSYPSKPGEFSGPRGSPWVDGDRVYTLSYWGDLHCFEARTGKVLWGKNVATEVGAPVPQWGHASSPYVLGDRIVLNVGESGCAVDKKSGEVLWKSGASAAGYATPIEIQRQGKTFIAVFGAKGLKLVDPVDGKLISRYDWETKYDVNAADPVYSNGKIFISSGYGKGCALIDIAGPQPREVWRNEKIKNHFSSSILIDGNLYGCDGNAGSGDLVCLDWATGNEKWRLPTGFGSVIAVGRHFVFFNEKGEVIVAKIDPAAATEVARGKVLDGGKSWTAPTYANGLLYFRNDQGKVACVRASAP